MAFVHSPKIVTDGLVLALDAGNVKSYPGSGTTWSDKSGFGNDGTLVNGPTFSSGNLGSIVFDGVDDYGTLGNPSSLQLTELTLSFWVKFEHVGSVGSTLISKRTSFQANQAFNFFIFASTQELTLDIGNTRLYGPTIETGVFYNCVATHSNNVGRIYLNGTLENSTSNSGISDNTADIAIGRLRGVDGSYFFNGPMYMTKIYNRALTSDEILQNYNATKGRFGL